MKNLSLTLGLGLILAVSANARAASCDVVLTEPLPVARVVLKAPAKFDYDNRLQVTYNDADIDTRTDLNGVQYKGELRDLDVEFQNERALFMKRVVRKKAHIEFGSTCTSAVFKDGLCNISPVIAKSNYVSLPTLDKETYRKKATGVELGYGLYGQMNQATGEFHISVTGNTVNMGNPGLPISSVAVVLNLKKGETSTKSKLDFDFLGDAAWFELGNSEGKGPRTANLEFSCQN